MQMDGMDRKIENKGKISKKTLWIAGGSFLIVVTIINAVFGDKSSKYNVEADKISIEPVKFELFQDYIAVIGTVEPIHTIFIDAVEGGKIEEKYLEEGAMVEAGDKIMKLSNTNLLLDIIYRQNMLSDQENNLRSQRLQMEQYKLSIKSQLIEMTRSFKQTKRLFDNNSQLFNSELISKDEYLKSKEDYEYNRDKLSLLMESQKQDSIFRSVNIKQLESSVGLMQENVALIKEKGSNLVVKAPVKGQIAQIIPELGQSMGAGQRLAQINVLESYKMHVEIDEHYIARIIRNLPGDFEFDGNTYQLEITKIYPEVKSGRFAVDMEFKGQVPKQIRIGQTARIRLQLGESKQALLVSRGGFYQSTGGQWIYVVSKDNKKAIKRNIHIGRQNPKYYEVLDGLEQGENVIVSSYETFGDADQLVLKK